MLGPLWTSNLTLVHKTIKTSNLTLVHKKLKKNFNLLTLYELAKNPLVVVLSIYSFK